MEPLPSWYVAALQQAWAEDRDIRYGIVHRIVSPVMDFPELFQQITRLPWRQWRVGDRRIVEIGSTLPHRMTDTPAIAHRIGHIWIGAECALRRVWGTPPSASTLWLARVAHWDLYRTQVGGLIDVNDHVLQQIVANHPDRCQMSRAEQWVLRHRWDPQKWYPFHEGTGAMRRAPFWGMWTLVPNQAAVMADMDARWAYQAPARLITAVIARTVSAALIQSTSPPMTSLLFRSIHRLTPRHYFLRNLIATVWKRYRQGIRWEEALMWISQEFHYYPWDHCVPNFLIVVIALLYAQQDFDQALKIVQYAGWDVATNALLTGVFLALQTSIDPDESWTPLLSSAIHSMVVRLRS